MSDRGRGPLVLSDLGQDLGRGGHGDIGERRLHERGDLTLVGRVLVRMEEADGDRFHAGLAEAVDHLGHPGGVDGTDDRPGLVGALGDGEPEPPPDEGLRHPHLEVVEVVAALAPDLEDVLEPLRGEERGPRAGALDHRVGDERGAVQGMPHPVGGRAGGGEELPHAVEDAAQGIAGRGEDLAELHPAARVEQGEVGEGAADVDAEAIGSRHCPTIVRAPGGVNGTVNRRATGAAHRSRHASTLPIGLGRRAGAAAAPRGSAGEPRGTGPRSGSQGVARAPSRARRRAPAAPAGPRGCRGGQPRQERPGVGMRGSGQ